MTLALLLGEIAFAHSPVQEEDHKPATADSSPSEKLPMPYVETSQFRKNFPFSNSVLTKAAPGKYIKKEIPTVKKDNKMKKLFKQLQEIKLTEKPHSVIAETPAPRQLPPFNDEIFMTFRSLPSNEEYDRNSRYQHSFLYGYDAF